MIEIDKLGRKLVLIGTSIFVIGIVVVFLPWAGGNIGDIIGYTSYGSIAMMIVGSILGLRNQPTSTKMFMIGFVLAVVGGIGAPLLGLGGPNPISIVLGIGFFIGVLLLGIAVFMPKKKPIVQMKDIANGTFKSMNEKKVE